MRGILTNLHTHTTFSDGQDTIDETVRAAIEKGFAGIGISDHAYTPMYEEGSNRKGMFPTYLAEIRIVAEKYPQISVYAGIENEYCYWQPTDGLDYVIGSVHYLPCNEIYHCVDYLPSMIQKLANETFGGDCIMLAQRYYEMVADMALIRKPNIIGHLDLITKLNKDGRFFDTQSDGYMKAVRTALDAIVQTDCIIEVNTGAMARGYTSQPYPEWHILRDIQKMGIPVTVSSDSHRSQDLDFAFAETAQMLRDIGFTSTRQILNGHFTDVGL